MSLNIGHRAVRAGDWKLVALAGKPWELYNLRLDHTEMHDLAAQHPQRVAEMADLYRQWAARTGLKQPR
jgi:arylsulfatase A-like enzyme